MRVTSPSRPRPDLDAEALIKQARRYQRRRRVFRAIVVVIAALALAIVLLATRPPRSSQVAGALQRLGKAGPLVNASALKGEGELAFVSRDDLYLLVGATGKVHEVGVPPGRTAVDPTFSPDGKWVAFQTETSQTPASGSQLWVARSNGADRHQVIGAVGYYGWDPAADVLAISTDTNYTQVLRGHMYREDEPTRLELVSPTGTRRSLVSLPVPVKAVVSPPPEVWDATWSPSGGSIAVAVDSFMTGSTVRSYPIDGGKATTWFSINATAQLPGICSGCGGGNTIAQLAGWWPKWGVGFWVFSSGAVHGLDSSPLELVHAPGATPHVIGHTLSNGTTVELAASRQGELALVGSVLDAGRSYGVGKYVETCDLASKTCTPVPGASTWTGPDPVRCRQDCSLWPASGRPGSAVSLDPAWSPDGRLLAFVKAPSADTGGWPPLSWFRAHELYVLNTVTHRSTKIGNAGGVSVPTWSRNGKDVLYVRDNALWLSAVTGGRATELASPLFSPTEWANIANSSVLSFYGQVDWTGQFDWWSP